MLVLALDTTTRQGSVALARDGGTLALYAGDAAVTHGVRLPGDLVRLLDAHGLRIADVELFAVAAGPGSFTGMRIGIATMQGLALANHRSLVGISALDAIHDAVSSQPSALTSVGAVNPVVEVAVWMDAQRGQVFSAVYRDGALVEPALADKPADILGRWAHQKIRPRLYAGDGALLYQPLIRVADSGARIIEPPALAPSIAALAETALRERGAATPDAIRPIYVRRSDAELVRDGKTALRVGTASE
jgi:tRNA threonylcarbamoyladenosine biosynthesis protein TsaB